MSDADLQHSYLADYVGEGKKYSTLEDLAKGYQNADSHIGKLEGELGELRQELEKRMTIEDLLKEQQESKIPENVQETPPAEQTQPERVEAVEDGNDLNAKVREILAQENAETVAKNNRAEVANKLKELYNGDKDTINKVLAERASELSVSAEWLADVAGKSPKAFFKTLGLDEPKSSGGSAAIKGDLNTQAVLDQRKDQNSSPKAGTYAAYEELRKTDPKTYWSPETQHRMFKEAQAKGADFYKQGN